VRKPGARQPVEEGFDKGNPCVRSVKRAGASGDSAGFVAKCSGVKKEIIEEMWSRGGASFLKDNSTLEEEAIILRMG